MNKKEFGTVDQVKEDACAEDDVCK